VVILGGGFAGLAAALELRADRHDVVLVDRRTGFEFLPNIHELLSGVKAPELLRLPLAPLLRGAGHRFLHDTVTAIDAVARTITTQRDGHTIAYDALILALGGVDATHGVPGVVAHALPFKSVEQCHRIGRRLLRLTESGTPGKVVIVGGGLEGVEALGEILRRHRSSRLQVTLVEARGRLLAEAPAALDGHVRELCEPYPIDFALGVPVKCVQKNGVVLDDGRLLPSDLTIWTGGPAPSPLLARSGLAPEGSWAPVETTLRSVSFPDVFVAGDAADLPTPLSKQGYYALDMGRCAASNVERLRRGRQPTAFRPSRKPTLISFGDLSCFLVLDGRVLAGPALAAAKEAVFELVMAQLDAQPWWRRLPRMLARGEQATRRLLWPSVSSLEALVRQGRLAVLSDPSR
jgi:NADH dehydrogenase